MITKKYICVAALACVMLARSVSSQNNVKSSLAFVIDDTSSMTDDIDQVKKGVVAIFDTVMKSKASDIEDFVLVTFNDPFITYRVTTKSRDEFMDALGKVKAHCTITGCGGDCPEMTLTGIERALQESRPHSHVYVFTDASSKDFAKYQKVKDLAQKMQSQIVFVLTGECGPNNGNSKVFHDLARDTSGQVFNIKKDEVHKILDYVKDTVENRKTVLAHKTLPTGKNKFTVTADPSIKELVISIAGKNVNLGVIGPDGKPATTEEVAKTANAHIIKIKQVKPGVYEVETNSDSESTVVVKGSTTVNFLHGFARPAPVSIDETATRPIPGIQSYLGIRLIADRPIELTNAQILDMDDRVIIDQPLKIVNKRDKFYVTDEFYPPTSTFKVAIKGIDREKNTAITRVSLTPVSPQPPPDPKDTTNRKPVVTVVGESKVKAEYEQPLELKCKVTAYPLPSVSWEDGSGNVIPNEVHPVELPYDDVSVIKIAKVNKNNVYKCKASNSLGEDVKQIEVETSRKHFKVLKKPEDTLVPYGEERKFECRVDALPPAIITWYKNGKQVSEDENIEIVDDLDGSALIISDMQSKVAGHYTCEAKNENENKKFSFMVAVTGFEPPVLAKGENEIQVKESEKVKLPCEVQKGKPKPTLKWSKNGKEISTNRHYSIDSSYSLVFTARKYDNGIFTCEAVNDIGVDTITIKVDVTAIQYRVTTKRRDEFLDALGKVKVHNGGDCPEMALTGIERALQESRPQSHLFVFTDASAKDPEKYKKVKDLAQKMQSQIVFVLTGECGPNIGNSKVFYDLARDTSGQVFNIKKDEVHKILEYVKDTVENRKTILEHKTLPPGKNKFTVTVDPSIKELVISISGKNVNLGVIGPDGKPATTEEVAKTANAHIIKIKQVRPGVYEVETNSDSESTVVVKGSTTVNFLHGFARPAPVSIDETATRPIPGIQSYLGIRLIADRPIELTNAQILDMDDRVIIDQPLKIVNKRDKFYVTNEFYPPTSTFKVAIKGFDREKNTAITRVSLTPVSPQPPPDPKETTNRKPVVTVVGESKLKAEYEQPLELKCKVTAYPLPSVTWEDGSGNVIPNEVHPVELPYDYVSVIKITKVNKNNVYKCKASNSLGEDVKQIEVETSRKHFKVLKKPEDTLVPYGEERKFECRVDALPPAIITWYKNGKQVSEDENIEIVDDIDGSALIISDMDSKVAGHYTCEAKNENENKKFGFMVAVTGFEPPVLARGENVIKVKESEKVKLPCEVEKGKPTPTIKWSKNGKEISTNRHYEIDSSFSLVFTARKYDNGIFTCEAVNDIGVDTITITLEVTASPKIRPPKKKIYEVRSGDYTILPCQADGYPQPEIEWKYRSADPAVAPKILKPTNKSGSLVIPEVQPKDQGFYTCIATNAAGSDKVSFGVKVNS